MDAVARLSRDTPSSSSFSRPSLPRFVPFLVVSFFRPRLTQLPLFAVQILSLSTPSLIILFDALWSAYPSLLNSSLLPAPSQSFIVAALECNAYLLQKRLRAEDESARVFAAEQVEKCWSEGVVGAAVGGSGSGRRRKVAQGRPGARGADVAGKEEAKLLGRGLEKVFSVDGGKPLETPRALVFGLTINSFSATGAESWKLLSSSIIDAITATTPSSDESLMSLPLPKLAPLLAALRITLPEVLVDSFELMIIHTSRSNIGSVCLDIGDLEEAEVDEAGKQLTFERVSLLLELVSLEKFAAVLREDVDLFVSVSVLIPFSDLVSAKLIRPLFCQAFDRLLANETSNLLRLLPPATVARLFRLGFSWRLNAESDAEIFEGLVAALSPSSTVDESVRLAVLRSLVADGLPLPAALGERREGSTEDVPSLDDGFSSLAESVLKGDASPEQVEVLKALMISPSKSP